MAEWQAQLDQVNTALAAKPNDPNLLKLKADIEKRNELLSELAGASGDSGAATASAGAASRWKVGDQVQAKFSADGLMYEATIESVTGTGSYGVVFKGYNNREVVAEGDIVALKGHASRSDGAQTINSAGGQGSTQILSTDTPAQRAAKKKQAKGRRTYQRRKEQEEKLNAGKQSWQNFNAKSKGKGKRQAGMARKSIFATPDTLDGKVGVVGSGTGMTAFEQPKKYRRQTE